ncbi:MAG: YkgJ family cysteine cluster protein [Desulforhopalus sp.]|nr:YkgJ family cysteine cluster protein [Desulforhopalus sp.]
MVDSSQPEQDTAPIDTLESFAFACHPGVACYTECCRLLELAISPYDALRLRQATSLPSQQLLEKYFIIEQDPGEAFPRVYLTMVDDGRASCVFVTKAGCSVYEHRPGACRTYPLGRAVSRIAGGVNERFVILRENHCQGFLETAQQTPRNYITDQGLTRYNTFNDAVMEILQHEAIRNGFIPSRSDVELFILALYNIDSFREHLFHNRLHFTVMSHNERQQLEDDESLLRFGIDMLHKQIFSQFIGNIS